MLSMDDIALVELHRAAALSDRPGIAIISRDAPRVDAKTHSRKKTHGAISRLRRSGRVHQVRRDLIVLPDAAGVVRTTLAELIAAIAPRPYLITGGAALEAHGLTDQHFFETVVLVSTPIEQITWRGETTRFLLTSPDRIWSQPTGAAAVAAEPLVAGAERALLDALHHSRYGVSLGQAVAALQTATDRDAAFPRKLFAATRRYGSASTARRAGFLVELLAGEAAAEPFQRLIGRRPGPTALRPHAPQDGEINKRWRLRVNTEAVRPGLIRGR